MREDSNVKKIIYLITDGEQNPKVSPNDQVLDPAVASQSLYDKGMYVYVSLKYMLFFYFAASSLILVCILFIGRKEKVNASQP